MISDEGLMLDFQRGSRPAFEELLPVIMSRFMDFSGGGWGVRKVPKI
jgi:hypothetical protein